MKDTYINEVLYCPLPAKNEKATPRDRFVVYWNDLHKINGDEISPETFTEGDQYSFTQLGDEVLGLAMKNDLLNELDLMVSVYWTPEYDPDYSSYSPYFVEHYNKPAKSFDICDNGSIPSYSALSTIQSFLQFDSEVNSAILVGLEQNTIPRNKAKHTPIPSRSSSGLIKLSATPSNKRIKLVHASVLLESEQLANQFIPQTYIQSILDLHEIDPSHMVVVWRRNSFVYKAYNYWRTRNYKALCENLCCLFLPAENTAMSVFQFLEPYSSENLPADRSYALVFDEDTESLATGVALFNFCC